MTAQQQKVGRRVVKAVVGAKKAAVRPASASAAAQRARTAVVRSSAAPTEHLQLHFRSIPTPLGPFSLFVDSDGAVRCCHWQRCSSGDAAALQKEQRDVCASLQSRWYKKVPLELAQPPSPASSMPGEEAATLLTQYFNPASVEAGSPAALERLLLQVPVVYPPAASPFMTRTWDVLRQTVPSGETISYKGLGVRVSQAITGASATTAAPRAIGMAMGANPIPIVVPCHRVLSSTNSLRGYGLGLRFKVWLLRHEQASVPAEKMRDLEAETAVSTAISLR